MQSDPFQITLTELRRTPGPALDRVRQGGEVIITEDGIPMGRIVPASRPTRFRQLVEQGLVRPPQQPRDPATIRARAIEGWRAPEGTA